MSSISGGSINIVDGGGGDAATVTDGKLDVNATVSAEIAITEFPTAANPTDNFANPSTTSIISMGMVYDGSAWDMLRGTSADGMLVNLGSNNDVTVNTISGFATSSNQLPDGHAVTVDNAIDAAVYARITNGTQVMPTMDAVGRAGFMKITDGSQVVNVTTNAELEVHVESIDGSVIFITKTGTASSASNSSVTVGSTSTEICAASAVRLSYTIVNDSDEVIYLSIEDAAVMNSGIRLNPNGGSFSDIYGIDQVFGICASGSKVVTVCQQHI